MRFTALSMVHHRDVESYLLALKSFCRFLHPRKIVMVADPSITDADRALIAEHVQGIEIVPAEDFRETGMPQGGCWERLIAISEYVQHDYVIQLDADTVTLEYPVEVQKAIAESRSFVLATEDGQDFVSCLEAANWAKPRIASGEHVQALPKPAWIGCLVQKVATMYEVARASPASHWGASTAASCASLATP